MGSLSVPAPAFSYQVHLSHPLLAMPSRTELFFFRLSHFTDRDSGDGVNIPDKKETLPRYGHPHNLKTSPSFSEVVFIKLRSAVVSLERLRINKLILDGYAINIIISLYIGNGMTQTKVFFVEDDEIFSKVIEWRLDTLGYTICGSATTGVEAIALIKEKKPDIVLLDIELKGHMDGIDVAEFLTLETKIPFIYLTSHTEDEILQRAINTKPKGYIKKPFSDDDLRVAIELAL